MDLRGNIYTLALCTLFVILTGCEVISKSEQLIEIPLPEDTTGRVHLLIEYTGFRCVNCPKAEEAAARLQQLYGKRLIVVAMHPASNPFTQGAYDYTCEDADVYYRYMGGLATTPFPVGNIDFAEQENGWLNDYPDWPAILTARMDQSAIVHLSAEGNKLSLYADAEQNCRMITWLVEDSVLGAQAMPDNRVDTQYFHRHVLRGAIGEPWGEEITVGLFPTEYTITPAIPAESNPGHCSAVVLIINENKELLNATEIRL